ncbi:MAG: S-layer homology domain-containing protein, partial [Clostridiales bacterium]|nr:S-layer homology domain-containing protein [Clostridiales bacterium]
MSAWAVDEARAAFALRLVPPNLANAYQEPITRRDFCVLAVTFIEAASARSIDDVLGERGISVPSGAFSDTDDYFVLRASALGVINGVGGGLFNPDAPITRQEAATMVWRLAEKLSLRPAAPAQAAPEFADAADIDSWAAEAVAYATSTRARSGGAAVMAGTGDGRFLPKGTYTREQSIIVMKRMAEATVYLADGGVTGNVGAGGGNASSSVGNAEAGNSGASGNSAVGSGGGNSIAQLARQSPMAPGSDYGRQALGNWNATSQRYIFARQDGYTILLAAPGGGGEAAYSVCVEEYSLDGQFLGYKTLGGELPLFGGAHQTSDGNFFLLYGQTNKEESPGKESIRVVKYSPSWQRLGAAAVSAGPSVIRFPFSCGSAKMAELGNVLTVHASRTRFTSSDGLNHESNLTIQIDMGAMRVLSQSAAFPANHASHSFDQFVRHDGDLTVYVDHGDAYPRSIYLQVFDGSGSASGTGGAGGAPGRLVGDADLLAAPGNTGDNYTGMTPGGFEVTASHYVVSASAIDMRSFGSSETRNAYILAVPRDRVGSGAVERRALTDFPAGGGRTAGFVYLVRATNNRLVALWEEYGEGSEYLATKYAVLDASGAAVGQIRETRLRLANNTQPIYRNKKIVWPYFASGSELLGAYASVTYDFDSDFDFELYYALN